MEGKKAAAVMAAQWIENDMTVGLGTGSTAEYLIEEVGERISRGLRIRAVATSLGTEHLARRCGISLIPIDEVEGIDLCIDGVDEIDNAFNAIKGGGGALMREKLVAGIADKVVWIMDSSKIADQLGRFPLPVEILPFGHRHVLKRMDAQGFRPELRQKGGCPFVTDNGNFIADLHLNKGFNLAAVSAELKQTTGVIETGLFVNMCNSIIVGTGDGVRVVENTFRR